MTPAKLQKLPKWAQDEFNAQQRQLELQRALCWPNEPKPVPYTSEEIIELISAKFKDRYAKGSVLVGWFANGSLSMSVGSCVSKGCSSGHYHSVGSTTEASSQGCGIMYATRREAYLAARWQLCQNMAEMLAALDRNANRPEVP
jgi:hypothetical protein